MTKKSKSFDCVEFKRRAQEKIMAEYEARKDEFASYVDFLNAKAHESEWQRILRAKFSQAGAEEAPSTASES